MPRQETENQEQAVQVEVRRGPVGLSRREETVEMGYGFSLDRGETLRVDNTPQGISVTEIGMVGKKINVGFRQENGNTVRNTIRARGNSYIFEIPSIGEERTVWTPSMTVKVRRV